MKKQKGQRGLTGSGDNSGTLFDMEEPAPEIDIRFDRRLAVFGSQYGASIEAIAEPAITRRLKIRPFSQRHLVGVVGEDQDGNEILFLPRKTTSSVPFDKVYACPSAVDVEAFVNRASDAPLTLLAPLPLNPKKDAEGQSRSFAMRSAPAGVMASLSQRSKRTAIRSSNQVSARLKLALYTLCKPIGPCPRKSPRSLCRQEPVRRRR